MLSWVRVCVSAATLCVCLTVLLLFVLHFPLSRAGKVEVLNGIHAVFKGLPLFWGRGYLGQALAVMERAASGDVTLSAETVNPK